MKLAEPNKKQKKKSKQMLTFESKRKSYLFLLFFGKQQIFD